MKLAVLGSTGSIGVQALEVAEKYGYEITALTGGRNFGLAEKQARRFNPKTVVMADETAAHELRARLADTDIKVLSGGTAIAETAGGPDCDTVLNSVVGIAGLAPTLAAARAGKRIALANKESLVAGGELVNAEAAAGGAQILPVDSEHSAIFQCLRGSDDNRVKKIFLTASGGPFFGKDRTYLASVGREAALKNPNWEMGARITVDSATLMNKGFELIEAVRLFGVSQEAVEIIIHRQSILHSAVMFEDNSVIGQLGVPDMRLPIQYALTYPARLASLAGELDLAALGTLTFSTPDYDTFKAPLLARKAIAAGGNMPAVLNGADEAAVALFLAGKLGFSAITEAVENALDSIKPSAVHKLEDVLEADAAARESVAGLTAR